MNQKRQHFFHLNVVSTNAADFNSIWNTIYHIISNTKVIDFPTSLVATQHCKNKNLFE